ncbi:MAG: hypothetical protein ACRETW_00415 [Stenotrophobium sp.]
MKIIAIASVALLPLLFITFSARAQSADGNSMPTPPPMIGDMPETYPPHQFPINTRGTKIGENESPTPQNRVFAAFNYWHDVAPDLVQPTGVGHQDVYRYMLGGEKAFDDENASIGIRAPVVTYRLSGSSGQVAPAGETGVLVPGSKTTLGNIQLIGKYAFSRNRSTGDLLSAGMLVSLPTAAQHVTPEAPGPVKEARDSPQIEPYFGYIHHWGRLFVQGFEDIAVPTQEHVAISFNSDVGLGYQCYQSDQETITRVVPMLEAHWNTLLTNPNDGSVKTIDLTQGLALQLDHRLWTTLGISENIAATNFNGYKKSYDGEVIAQFNYSF